jgi:uncharacterized protein YidB (DUF937 family)
MGLFDDLESKAASSMLGGSSNPLATGLLQMINNQPGGLPGLLQSFHEKGLGGLAASWVLGSDQVTQLAAKAGISPDAAGAALTQLLPSLVDRLTPNGQMPQHSNLLEMGMSILQSFGKTGTNG